jgi:shikimate kinase
MSQTPSNSHQPPTLILMGLRGCGKTTLGQLLAQRTNRPWIDLDPLTALEAGFETPAEAFAHDQAAFRAAESRALSATLRAHPKNAIISLGGGTPTAPGAHALLSEAPCLIVYLHASPKFLAGRLTPEELAKRPSITGAHPIDEMQQIYEARDPLYRSLANVIIDVESLSAANTLDQLVKLATTQF